MYMYMWAGKDSPSQTSAKRAHTDYDQLVHVIGCNSGIDITQVKFPQSNSYYKRGNVLHSKLHKHHMMSN